jgi:hypothetical protein
VGKRIGIVGEGMKQTRRLPRSPEGAEVKGALRL